MNKNNIEFFYEILKCLNLFLLQKLLLLWLENRAMIKDLKILPRNH